MRSHTKPPSLAGTDPSTAPPFWFLKYHEATLSGESGVARNAQRKLREFGYEVRPVQKTAGAAP